MQLLHAPPLPVMMYSVSHVHGMCTVTVPAQAGYGYGVLRTTLGCAVKAGSLEIVRYLTSKCSFQAVIADTNVDGVSLPAIDLLCNLC